MSLAIFIGFSAMTLALVAGGFALRGRLTPRQTLAATLVTPVAIVGALFSGAYWWDGPAIIAEGAGPMGDMLPIFEKQMGAWKSEPRSEKTFSVWVLGDSTQQSRGDAVLRLAPTIAESVMQRGIRDVQVYGVQSANCNAYEFYFLMSRLLDEPPDLVIMPLNLRAFGPRWIDNPANGFPVLERYVPWSRVREAAQLSARGRKITTVGVVLRKLDYRFFGSRTEWFLNGLKLRAEGAGKAESEGENKSDEAIPAERAAQADAEQTIAEFRARGKITYDQNIREDHPVITVFHAIDRMAASRGIGVLYYTVQTPDERAEPESNFTALRWSLARDPAVRFVEMLDAIPKEDFELLEHFRAPGMRALAGRLTDEIVKARDDASWRAKVRGLAALE
jgi:hypothetical protein